MIFFNKLCLFENNRECTNKDVTMDWRGCCSSMVNIRLTKEKLEYSKMYTKLILEHNDDYYFDDETGDFMYLEDKNK